MRCLAALNLGFERCRASSMKLMAIQASSQKDTSKWPDAIFSDRSVIIVTGAKTALSKPRSGPQKICDQRPCKPIRSACLSRRLETFTLTSSCWFRMVRLQIPFSIFRFECKTAYFSINDEVLLFTAHEYFWPCFPRSKKVLNTIRLSKVSSLCGGTLCGCSVVCSESESHE